MAFRQTIGRALRETGQALDRVGIMGRQHALTTRLVGDDPYKFHDHLSRHRHQMPLLRRGAPIVSKQAAFVAPCSTLIGSVRIGPGASVWYRSILRADSCDNVSHFSNPEDDSVWELEANRLEHGDTHLGFGGGIFIGEDSNVQDGCIISSRVDHTIVGKGVTIGHMAQIHSATIHDFSLIGMGSYIGEGVVVESESFIAAGAVVARGTIVPSGQLWVGHPARKLRDLSPLEREKLHYQSDEVSNERFHHQMITPLLMRVVSHLKTLAVR
jgi:carbonic anhydrase/acetyltransferase-like protein (isoleucine patch superfamily)